LDDECGECGVHMMRRIWSVKLEADSRDKVIVMDDEEDVLGRAKL